MLKSTKFRWLVAVVGLALIALFIVATGQVAIGEPLRPTLGPGPIEGTHYVARAGAFSEQQLVCAGEAVPLKLVKLDSSKVIVKVTICDDYPNRHDFMLERSALTADVLDQLSLVLALPDRPRNDFEMCTMEFPMLPSLVIELQSGVVLRPTVPINSCRKPMSEAADAISAIENFQFPQD